MMRLQSKDVPPVFLDEVSVDEQAMPRWSSWLKKRRNPSILC